MFAKTSWLKTGGIDYSKVSISFNEISEEVDALAGIVEYNFYLNEVPTDCLLCDLKDGEVVRFRYQKSPLWIGFGEKTIWKRDAESTYRKFWDQVLALPEGHDGTEEVKGLKEIVLDNRYEEI